MISGEPVFGRDRKPTLHLIVGLPASGKTVFAKKLEQDGRAVRFTPDEWHLALFGDDLDHPDHDRRHASVEALMWRMASRVLACGVDAILDFGFWARAERDDYKLKASALGALCKIHFHPIGWDEHVARLDTRNAALPDGAFRISRAQLTTWSQLFEPPTREELNG